MDRSTILKLRTACDLKKLRLSSLEGFMLSQLDGKLTLEEVAEIASLDLDETIRVARILILNEAVTIVEVSKNKVAKAMTTTATRTSEAPRSRRIDPRVEERTSIAPRSGTKRSIVPRVDKVSLVPQKQQPQQPQPQQKPPARKSRRSLRMQRPIIPRNTTPPRRTTPPPIKSAPAAARASASAPAPAPVPAPAAKKEEEVCELDGATTAKIDALFKIIDRVDHYTFLELERGVEKKAIKRAYFAFVSKFHPDRFFGKKLGAHRVRIERVFEHATLAHDTLTDAAHRSEYDARLPPQPSRVSKAAPAPTKAKTTAPPKLQEPAPPVPPPPPPRVPKAPSQRKMSKAAMRRASSRQMRAVVGAKKPSSTNVKKEPAAAPAPPPPAPTTQPRDRMKQLRNAMMEVQVQTRVDALLEAAEASLKADNVVEAANNYRLALEHRDDPGIRMKFEEVDRFARSIRFEKHMTVARAAERNQQWADAATYLQRAYEAMPSADIAERRAIALRLGGGDLEEAIELAEEAVEREPKNARYRITLADIYLATNQFDAAEDEAETALELAPKDERASALLAAIARKKKASK